MAGEAENRWLEIFAHIKNPDNKEPWLEFRCEKDSSLFLGKFVSTIGNVPALDESNHGFYFRGQTNAGWTLKPKLFRLWEYLLAKAEDKKEIVIDALGKEFDAIQYFRKRVRYLDNFSRSLDSKLTSLQSYLDWLALMQHYSAPTRLLDWTTSFYIALYFACENDSTDGAVWMLNKEPIVPYMGKLIEDLGYKDKGVGVLSSHDKYVEFGLEAAPILEVVSNQSKTDRMIAQGSVFTISLNLFYDHAQVGLPFIGKPQIALIKLVIPSLMKKDIRMHLSKMDIFAERLFPGIEGVGRTIEEKICLHQDVFYK